MRSRFLIRVVVVCGLCSAFLLPVGCRSAGQNENSRPNVILIMADDLGYETLGCYGGRSYHTPVLDALASSGMRFSYAFAQPLCTPTRVQLMTGRYNFRNWKAFGILDPAETTFAHLMKEAGYVSLIAGKWQLYSYDPPDYPGAEERRGTGMLPENSGFDEFLLWHAGHTEEKGSRYADPTYLDNGVLVSAQGGYGPDVFVKTINSFIERHQEERFFVYYPMALTHAPFVPTPQSTEWADPENRLQANKKFFADMVDYMDVQVGRIVAKLDELDLREKTLILFYSDNGSPLGIVSQMGNVQIEGGKGKTSDAGIRVPLIANWKGKIQPGQVCEDLIDSSDFLPTLVEAAGAKLPEKVVYDGRSFFPQLVGREGRPRDWVFFHYDPRPGWAKDQFTLSRFVRNRTFKLYEDGRLFNVEVDPLEEHPIRPGAGSPEAESVRNNLQSVFERMR